MSEGRNQPGKRQALISMILALTAFLYLLFVPMYITAFFVLILGVIGLIQAVRAKRRGYDGLIRAIGLIVSIINIAVSVILIGLLIAAFSGVGGEP